MDTIVVFIENKSRHADLVHSLNILDIPFVRLYEGGKWTSHFNKLQIYIDGLKDIKNEWVLLSDSRDVLFYKDLKEINAVYDEYYSEYDFVIQAEDTLVGDVFFKKTRLQRYTFGNHKYKYPCSGLIIGKRKILISFFQEIIDTVPEPWDVADQPAIEWGLANLTNYNFSLDHDCRLFQQMAMEDFSGVNYHLHFTKDFIKNEYTQTEPCVFHGAGRSFLQPVWKVINRLY